MSFEELQRFIDEQDALFRSLKDSPINDREHIFGRTIKLGEEFGELCDQVLASVGYQRKDKLKDPSNLSGEFADVVIVTLLLAKAMRIDVRKALSQKIKKIKEEHNKQL